MAYARTGYHGSGSAGEAWTGSDKDLVGIPSWNGDPSGWKYYRRQVAIWLEGINLHSPWSWASRMVRVLKGPAKMLADSIPLEALRPHRWGDWDPEAGLEDVDEHGQPIGLGVLGDWRAVNLMAGIDHLLDVLQTIGTTEHLQRGNVQKYFYKSLHRRQGEDMQSWCVRFGDARRQL